MRRLLLSALLVLGGLLTAAPALHADDGKPAGVKGRPDFVRQLSANELSFLRKKFDNWDAMSADKRQRIAQNVVRLRTMTPEEKKRLDDHIKRMKQRGKGRGRGRTHDHATRVLIGRALVHEARRVLGRDFERELRKRDISEHAFEVSLGQGFWRKLSEQRRAAGAPVAPDALPADFPARWREHYEKAHATYASLPAESKERAGHARRLHFKLAMHEGGKFRAKVRAMDLKGEAQLDGIAAAIREQWPDALTQTLEDRQSLIKDAEKYELRRAVQRLLRRTEKLEKEEAAVLVSLLNRLAVHHRKKPADADGRAESDALLKAVLQRELKVPAEALAAMPPASQPEERLAFFAGLAGRMRVHGFGGMHGRGTHRGGSHPGGRGAMDGRSMRRNLPKLEKPEGVSDADWAIYKTMRDAAFETQDHARLRSFWTQKPEGMTDAGYQTLVKALREHLGHRGGNRSGDRKKGRRGPR